MFMVRIHPVRTDVLLICPHTPERSGPYLEFAKRNSLVGKHEIAVTGEIELRDITYYKRTYST